MSSGDLVFFLGSDDYLVSPGLEGVTQRLAMEPSLAGIALTMCYFSESSGLDLATLPPHSAEEALNGSVDEVIYWMMHHVNHDELVIAVWRKSAIAEALALVLLLALRGLRALRGGVLLPPLPVQEEVELRLWGRLILLARLAWLGGQSGRLA